MNVKPFEKNVFFQFVDETTNTKFANKSSGGLVIASTSTVQAEVSRWVKITHIGPSVESVEVGEYALVEKGKWTTAFKLGKERYWKTDEDNLHVASDVPGSSYV